MKDKYIGTLASKQKLYTSASTPKEALNLLRIKSYRLYGRFDLRDFGIIKNGHLSRLEF